MHVANALLVMAIARVSRRSVGRRRLPSRRLCFRVSPGRPRAGLVTGRVDSMPAFFYLATFLAYVHWRRDLDGRYAAALALFFVALFSKQNTITMAATLAVYDLFFLDREQRGPVARAILAWAPFVVMTGGFLLLRRAIFGHSLRTGQHAGDEIGAVTTMLGHHVRRTLTGQVAPLRGRTFSLP